MTLKRATMFHFSSGFTVLNYRHTWPIIKVESCEWKAKGYEEVGSPMGNIAKLLENPFIISGKRVLISAMPKYSFSMTPLFPLAASGRNT
jgi:hypothetical protein